MRRIIFLMILFAFSSSVVFAQINRPEVIKKKTTGQTKTTPAPTTAPATVTPVYSLTAVKANIRTGADNKEFPSTVWVFLSSRSNTATASFKQENLKNEMKSNSNTEFGLEKSGNGSMTLDDLQKSGLQLQIWYHANFQFDAWKIEGVSITLEFRDQNNNLHPTYGQKTITFGNANGFLNGYFERKMICTTDGYFNPLSAQVTE
jgi:hypothetical protein